MPTHANGQPNLRQTLLVENIHHSLAPFRLLALLAAHLRPPTGRPHTTLLLAGAVAHGGSCTAGLLATLLPRLLPLLMPLPLLRMILLMLCQLYSILLLLLPVMPPLLPLLLALLLLALPALPPCLVVSCTRKNISGERCQSILRLLLHCQ